MKKKITYFCMALIVAVVFTFSNFVVAASVPRLGITSPSAGTVQVGGTIRYVVNIYNDATSVNLKPSDIRVAGVTCTISVEGSGNSQRTIVLSNIQGSVGSTGYISYIAGGVASNEKGGSREMNITSIGFTVVASQSPQPSNPQPSNPQPSNPQPSNPQPSNPGTTLPPSSGNGNGNSSGNGNSNGSGNGNGEATDPEKPEEKKDNENPKMKIGNLSATKIKVGEEITFDVTYSDDVELKGITLSKKDIKLYGFKADIKITGDGDKRTVTLSNITGSLGGLKYIKVAKGTAVDKAGKGVESSKNTEMFKIIDDDTKNKPDDWIENPNTGKW